MMPSSGLFGRAAATSALIAVFCLGAAPAALPYQVAGDVGQSFKLLTSTYYEPVDPQALLAAASDALAETARKHGVTIAPPVLRRGGRSRRNASRARWRDCNRSAQTAHASPSDFAYAAIDRDGQGDQRSLHAVLHARGVQGIQRSVSIPQRIGGIGVMIEPDPMSGCVRITYVLPSTPAERAGLRVGDIVTGVDGLPTKGLSVDAVSGRLRGKPARFRRCRAAADAPAAFTITREDVQPPTVVFKMLPDGIGYIWVMEFGRATPAEFDTAIARLNQLGAKALVLRFAQRRRRLRELGA